LGRRRKRLEQAVKSAKDQSQHAVLLSPEFVGDAAFVAHEHGPSDRAAPAGSEAEPSILSWRRLRHS
jgi:hypothetical protein